MTHHNHPVCNVILPRHIAEVVLLTEWRGNRRQMFILYVHTGDLSIIV